MTIEERISVLESKVEAQESHSLELEVMLLTRIKNLEEKLNESWLLGT